jgi:hypothetical protein
VISFSLISIQHLHSAPSSAVSNQHLRQYQHQQSAFSISNLHLNSAPAFSICNCTGIQHQRSAFSIASAIRKEHAASACSLNQHSGISNQHSVFSNQHLVFSNQHSAFSVCIQRLHSASAFSIIICTSIIICNQQSALAFSTSCTSIQPF